MKDKYNKLIKYCEKNNINIDNWYNLKEIICYSTNEYKKLAWEYWVKNNLFNWNNLNYIICYATNEYKKLAWEYWVKNDLFNEYKNKVFSL